MRSWRSAQGLRAAASVWRLPGLMASGCGGDGGGAGADGKVEIRYSWWGGQERATLINKTIALFEKKHPNIKVKTDFQDCENFWKKFNTQASAGNAPHVFQNSVAFLRKYDDKRVLLDLNSRVKAGNLSMENFRAGLEKAGNVDGKPAARAWEKFYKSDGYQESAPWKTEKVSGPVTTVAGSEANWVCTNDTALHGLAAIENLALLGDRMPA